MNKKYLVMIPVRIEYKVVEVEMAECSEEEAWELGTEAVKNGKQLQKFAVDLVGAEGGRKQIAQDLLKIGSVYLGQESQKAKEWTESMKRNGSF